MALGGSSPPQVQWDVIDVGPTITDLSNNVANPPFSSTGLISDNVNALNNVPNILVGLLYIPTLNNCSLPVPSSPDLLINSTAGYSNITTLPPNAPRIAFVQVDACTNNNAAFGEYDSQTIGVLVFNNNSNHGYNNYPQGFQKPAFLIDNVHGQALLTQLQKYAGSNYAEEGLSDGGVSNGTNVAKVRVELAGPQNLLPSVWTFLLIVVFVFLVLAFLTSLALHLSRWRRRREILRNGGVLPPDLEPGFGGMMLGARPRHRGMRMKPIKKTVPKEMLDDLKTYYYSDMDAEVPVANDDAKSVKSVKSTRSMKTVKSMRSANFDPAAAAAEILDKTPAVPAPERVPALVAQEHSAESSTAGNILSPTHHRFTSSSTCPICIDDYTTGQDLLRELPCGHAFHADCIDPYLLERSDLCPLCKRSVIKAVNKARGIEEPEETEAEVVANGEATAAANTETTTTTPVGAAEPVTSETTEAPAAVSPPPTATSDTFHDAPTSPITSSVPANVAATTSTSSSANANATTSAPALVTML